MIRSGSVAGMRTVRLQSMLPFRGRKFGDVSDWPDDEHTWALVATGALRLLDEPDEPVVPVRPPAPTKPEPDELAESEDDGGESLLWQ